MEQGDQGNTIKWLTELKGIRKTCNLQNVNWKNTRVPREDLKYQRLINQINFKDYIKVTNRQLCLFKHPCYNYPSLTLKTGRINKPTWWIAELQVL